MSVAKVFGRDAEAFFELVRDFLEWFIGGLTGFFSGASHWGV
jgi:hypothetical protein